MQHTFDIIAKIIFKLNLKQKKKMKEKTSPKYINREHLLRLSF